MAHVGRPTLEDDAQLPPRLDAVSTPVALLESEPGSLEDGILRRASERICEALSESPPRLAYALQVTRLVVRTGFESDRPLDALLEAAALSDYLRLPGGPIAQALEHVFKRFPPTITFSSGDWRDRYVLLGLAGVLRPSLLAPQSDAWAFLAGFRPSDRLGAVYEFTKAVSEQCQILQGARIDSAVLRSAGSQARWQEERDHLIAAVNAWQSRALHKTFKYAPATSVWQRWLKAGGVIHDLLSHVTSGKVDEARTRELASKLSYWKTFKEQVNHTDRREIGRRRGQDIAATALNQLHAHALEAVGFAQRKLNLYGSRASQSDFIISSLGRIREQISRLAPNALEELHAFGADATPWPAGVANVAVHAVELFRDLIEARDSSEDTEPDPAQIFASGLFGFPFLVVDDRGEPEGDARLALDRLLDADSPDRLGPTFEQRLEAGDLGSARRIVEWLEFIEPDESTTLRERLDSAFSSQAAKLRRGVNEVRARIEREFIREVISEEEQRRHQATLADCERRLDESRVLRFDLERKTLLGIESTLEVSVGEQRNRAKLDLETLALPPDTPEYRRIAQAIRDGDLIAAKELIHQQRSGTAPEPADPNTTPQRTFEDFYPECDSAIDKEIERRHLPQIVSDFRRPGDITSLAGMSLRRVPGAQLQSAGLLLETWAELKRFGPQALKKAAGAERLETLFTSLGLIVRKVTIERVDRDSAVVSLRTDPLTARERCPIPEYGSFARGRYRVVLVRGRPTEEDVLQHASTGVEFGPTIVLYLGRFSQSRREALGALSRQRSRALLVLDERLLVFLCAERGSRLPVFFACALPFSFVQPYVTTAGVVPPEMFYGREREMNEVVDRSGTVFIYGGRQLGKTALLRAVESDFHRPVDGRFAIWLDLKGLGIGHDREPSDIWHAIWHGLRDIGAVSEDVREPRPRARQYNVEEFINHLCSCFDYASGKRLLLLLDEADGFLELDAQAPDGKPADQGYRESTRLKALMDRTDRRIKVVFAGLHNVLRTVRSANHPLGHFGQPLQIGPFLPDGRLRTAELLVTQPLRAAGYSFDNENLVTRILAQTNYYPSLIQHYGAALIKAMNSRRLHGAPLHTIDEQILDETYQKTNLREVIRSRFHLTLQLDPRYEVIAYALANQCAEHPDLLLRGVERRRIEDRAREWWPRGFEDIDSYTDGFWSLLDEMEGLGVLRAVDERREYYSLRNANVLPLMGTDEEITDSLLREREPPQEFNREHFRARKPGGSDDAPQRSPLTFHQEDLLRADRNGIALVCGLRATGFDEVPSFLTARIGKRAIVNLEDLTDQQAFDEELRHRLNSREERVTIYVVPASAPWGEGWMQASRARLRRLHAENRYAHIMFMADPACLWQLLPTLGRSRRTGFDWVSLRSWHEPFIRQWMTDVGFGNDPNMRRRIVELTGGWWVLLEWLHADASESGALESSLDKLDSEIEIGGLSKWTKLFALDRSEVQMCLHWLVEGTQGFQEDICEYAGAEGIDLETVTRVLEWAEVLRLVSRTGMSQGQPVWRMDPVAARLLRRVHS